MEIEELLNLVRSINLAQFRQALTKLKKEKPKAYTDIVNFLLFAKSQE